MTHDENRAATAAAWELEIERFAAGELGRDDEARFLARCESEPEHWRAVALACAEHRRLGRLLESVRMHGAPASAAMLVTGSAPRVPQRLLAIAAAVALLVVGAGVGYSLGRGPTAQPAAIAGPQPPIDPALAEQLATLTRPLLPEAAAEVLRQAGIDVHEEPVVYIVDGSDGERWAVPETQLELRLAKDHVRQP
jgi:hypothetical protein